LWENDVYAFDPLARLRTPRVQKIHRKPFTQDEATRLVQVASMGPNPIRDRALLMLMFDTGCRVGEMCAATLSDIDVDEGVIVFNRTKNGRPRAVKFRVQGRRDGGPALAAMRQWLKVREARPGVEALFTTREKMPLSTRACGRSSASSAELRVCLTATRTNVGIQPQQSSSLSVLAQRSSCAHGSVR
jgi:integrase